MVSDVAQETENETKTYSFEIDATIWDEWKNTVPRDKSLDTRIRELIEEDTDD